MNVFNCQIGKTEAMAINFDPANDDRLYIGEYPIEYVNSSKVLGIWIDRGLT